MSTEKILNKKVFLKQAQLKAREEAGTLQEGIEYEITDALDAVEDVKISGGATLVDSTTHVATIPTTNINQLGAVALANQYGLEMHGSAAGYIGLSDASDSAITGRLGKNNSGYGAVTPVNLNKAVMEGLNPAATFTGWTDAKQTGARTTINAAKQVVTNIYVDDI